MLAWDPNTMSTGVEEIDLQHRELIKRLNVLFDRMKRGEGAVGLKDLLDFIAKYTAWHFGREESCMASSRCPVAAANKNAHAEFIHIFTVLRTRLEQEGATASLIIEIQRQLSSWLKNHIVRVDTKLRDCIVGGQAKSA